jgi:hypothetical protein
MTIATSSIVQAVILWPIGATLFCAFILCLKFIFSEDDDIFDIECDVPIWFALFATWVTGACSVFFFAFPFWG